VGFGVIMLGGGELCGSFCKVANGEDFCGVIIGTLLLFIFYLTSSKGMSFLTV
jgi:uncharacterized membrane protein YjjP (DUF1212 family)